MLYPVSVSEQHMSIYEVLIHKLDQFIETLDILSTGHFSKTLILPIQFTHMLDQAQAAL